jgi:SAM-dependent methyltransferase
MTEDSTSQATAEAKETWEFVAAGWIRNAELIDRWSVPAKEWLVDQVNPQPGQTVLELAAGAGDTGFAVAERLGADGHLISTDIAPEMVDACRRRAGERGLTNAEFRVMDAQTIDLEDSSTDAVIHRFGPMLLPDPRASLAEVRRVLRPGGRYAAVVWGAPEHNPWLLIQGISIVQSGAEPPSGDLAGPGGIFSLADPDVLRGLVADAGFEDVTVTELDQVMDFVDADELWKLPAEISGPIAVAVRNMPTEQREAFRESFTGLAEQYREGEGYRIPSHAVCVSARRP